MATNNSSSNISNTSESTGTTGKTFGAQLAAAWDFTAYLVLPPVCWALAFFCCATLLFCSKRKPHLLVLKKGQLSVPMQLLLWTHCGNCAVFLFSQYVINNLVQINPTVINASNWLNTWWSFWVGNYLMAVPAAIFFLVLERFLALRWNVEYGRVAQSRLATAAVVVQLMLYAFSLWNVLLAWPYDKMCLDPGTENNPVANRPCLPLINKITNYTQQVIKISFAMLNLGISLLFFVMLARTKIPNVRNGIVKMTVLCELVLDVIPALLSLLFSMTNISLSLNVYLLLMASLDAAICAGTYVYLLFRRFRKNNVVEAAPPTTMVAGAHSALSARKPTITMAWTTAAAPVPANTASAPGGGGSGGRVMSFAALGGGAESPGRSKLSPVN